MIWTTSLLMVAWVGSVSPKEAGVEAFRQGQLPRAAFLLEVAAERVWPARMRWRARQKAKAYVAGASYLRGRIALRQGHLPQAVAFLRLAAQNDPIYQDYVLYHWAEAQMKRQEPAKAIPLYRKLLRTYRRSRWRYRARKHLALALEQSQQWDGAVHLFRRLRRWPKRYGGRLRVLYRLGRAWMKNNRYKRAARVFREILLDYPSHRLTRQVQRHLATLMRQKKLRWRPLGAWERLGQLNRIARRHPRRALRELQKMRSLPDVTRSAILQAHITIFEARFLLRLRRFAKARQLLEGVYRRGPQLSIRRKAKYWLALSWSKEGKLERATKKLHHFAETEPQDEARAGYAAYQAAYLALRHQKYARARELFEEYLEVYPYGRYRLRSLRYHAWALYRGGWYQEAVVAFRRWSREARKSRARRSTLYWTARSYERRRWKRTARRYYRRLTRHHPLSYYGLLARRRLEQMKEEARKEREARARKRRQRRLARARRRALPRHSRRQEKKRRRGSARKGKGRAPGKRRVAQSKRRRGASPKQRGRKVLPQKGLPPQPKGVAPNKPKGVAPNKPKGASPKAGSSVRFTSRQQRCSRARALKRGRALSAPLKKARTRFQPRPRQLKTAPPFPRFCRRSKSRSCRHLRRALALFHLGLVHDATHEAYGGRWVLRQRTSRLVRAIRWFLAAGAYHYAVLLSFYLDRRSPKPTPKTRDRWEMRYPLAYPAKFIAKSRQVGIPLAYALAISREESLFNPKERSWANARGLMQIIPPTGRKIAQRIGLSRFHPRRLYDPDLNVTMGCWYLGELLKKFQDNVLLASAAYNAGPHRVTAWLRHRRTLEPDEFVEEIPFSETRGYVKRVLRSYAVYRYLYQGERLSIPNTVAVRIKQNINF